MSNDDFKTERMTDASYADEEARIFSENNIPPEFRGTLSYMAYERGHSAGMDECVAILGTLASDLADSIKAFEKRIRDEYRDFTSDD